MLNKSGVCLVLVTLKTLTLDNAYQDLKVAVTHLEVCNCV